MVVKFGFSLLSSIGKIIFTLFGIGDTNNKLRTLTSNISGGKVKTVVFVLT